MLTSLWGELVTTSPPEKTKSPAVLKSDLPVDQVRLDAERLLVRICRYEGDDVGDPTWSKSQLSRASGKDVSTRERRDAAILFLVQQGWIDVIEKTCAWNSTRRAIHYRGTRMGRAMARMIKNADEEKRDAERRQHAASTAVGVEDV